MFNKALPYLVTWDVEEAAEKLHERTKLILTDHQKIKLKGYMHLLIYPPVIDESHKTTPLNDLENNNEWGMMIEFGVDPIRLLPTSIEKHKKAKLFDNCAFSSFEGSMLPDFLAPECDETHSDFSKNEPLTMCLIIYFDAVLPRCCQAITLQCHIASRLGHKDTSYREELMSAANGLHPLNKPMRNLNKIPM